MSKFAGFNREFWQGYGMDGPGPIKINWIDKLGAYNLDENRVVELRLATRGHANRYEGYRVQIIHKQNGVIAQHYFRFDDHMDTSMGGRMDERNDYPLGDNI